MEEYDIETEFTCPKCGHSPLHSRTCNNWCDDGWFDEHDEDPINFSPGEEYSRCEECKGTGIERWCPSCGTNLSGHRFEDTDEPNRQDILYH